MKASEQKPTTNNPQLKPFVQSFGPGPYRNINKSLLDKYSFEDNELSRTSQLISEMNQDDEDWLRLEIKEITSIGKELITFYLEVKYLVEYQGENARNFDKKKGQQKQSESMKEVKDVKSKLVHGSILQTEQKNLVLNIKCKKQAQLPQNTKPTLVRLQFQIMRIFQTKNQPVLIAKQIINNPEANAEYEISFQEINPPQGTKPKSVVAMIFQINSAIHEQLDGSEDDLSESRNDQVSQHLDGDEDAQKYQKYQNYTLGKSQLFKPSRKAPPSTHNIFDNTNHEESFQQNNSNNDTSKFVDDNISIPNQDNSYLSNQKSSNAELIEKLNQLSNMMDENLEKSKNEDQAYRSYLEETSNMIQMYNNESSGNAGILNAPTKAESSPNFLKNKAAEKSTKPAVQVKYNKPKQGSSSVQPQSQPQPFTPNQNPNKSTLTPNDSSSMGQRYNYISRIQNTYIAGQRYQYESRINNSNSGNTDNQKFNYFSHAQITNNKTAGDKNTMLSKSDDSNIVGERYNFESPRQDDTNVIGERYDYESRIENSNILDQSNLNELSAISPIQLNSPLIQKKSNFNKKEPFLKFNMKKQPNLVNGSGSPRKAIVQNTSENRSAPFNFADLDSSNIRYQYNDNDVSNIQETKNMQDLINQIQKIQKEWYEKRVLNRKSRQQRKQQNENQDDQNKLKPLDLAQNQDDMLDLQLKNFKIKFSEQTFTRKLIDGLKSKHQTYAKRQEANQKGQSQVPKNYLVFLIASEVDDQNMDYQSEKTSKIQIKIPSQQIDKLLQLQSIEKQRSLSNSGSNSLSPTISKIQEKQIIKAFEKQIYSKVMKIKLSKNDKNGQGEKKKARIIQIALEDQSLTLSQLQIPTTKDPQQNRISLVGMYPLPIFGDQNKDGETSFYQNVSIQPLAIELYDTKTGVQEGQIQFQLTKAKVDREIQTLQPLENIDDPYQEVPTHRNQRTHHQNSSLLVGYEVHQDKNAPQNKPENKSIKKSQTESKLRQRLLQVQIVQPYASGKPSNMKGQQKNFNRQLKIQSQTSQPVFLKNQQIPTIISMNFGDNNKKRVIPNGFAQPQRQKSHHELTPVNDTFGSYHKNNNLGSKQQKNDQEVLSSISKVRPKSIQDFKVSSSSVQVQSPKKEKDVDTIGKIVKNQSSLLIEMHPFAVEKDHDLKVKVMPRQNKAPIDSSKPKLVPELQMSNIRKVNAQSSPRQKNNSQSPIRLYNTSSGPLQAFPNSPSSIHQNHDPQSDSSYFLMKQQFMATANLLESIKIKAQQFIEKVESERKIHTSDQLQSDKEGWKGFESQGESKVAYTLPIEKKMINLGVSSFVVNETVLSRRQVSRNTQTPAHTSSTPQTVPINPKVSSHVHSKRTSTNKSRNQKLDPSSMQPRRNKFTVSPDKQSQSLKSRNKNYEKEVQSNGSLLSIHQRKSKRRDKPKKALVYKQESDYQFTQEEDRIRDDNKKRYKEQKPYISSTKILDMGEQSDLSNQLQSSGLNDSLLPYNHKGTLPSKISKRPIKQSAISSYSSQQIIEIKIFSLKIKLLSFPLVAKHLRNLSEDVNKGKDYFVLVYTDFVEGNREGLDKSLTFMPPVSQKCLRKNSAKDDQFVALFSDNTDQSPKGKAPQCYLLLKGIEKTKVVVELYQISEPLVPSQKSSQKDVTSLEHISLITLSPKNKKSNKPKPFASLTVTFIELIAQQQSGGTTSRVQKPDLITYTNFLYEKQKILGKININYITQLQPDNHDDHGSHDQVSRNKNKLSTSRKQAIEQYKPLKNSYLKNYPDSRKNSQPQKANDLKKLRSQSGMTKKLTPRGKMRERRSEQHSQNERNSLRVTTNQADPLQILKRKVPRPIKSEQKSNKHSLSYAIRLNRPYHTPTSKIQGKQLFQSLNSSSSAQFKGEKIRQRRQKNSVYSSSHFEGGPFMQSPKKGQDNSDLMQLRQKKQEKKLKRLKEYQAASRIPMPYQQTQETRMIQNRRYGGGNIKFGKSSRFNSADSQELISRKESKGEIPGPGHYEVKSSFDRHLVKEP